ncbi:MAG TPA: helix-turn-helix transcriptional regulator [Actinospica sp.]|jgi:transcriptional regulator with XRE-family HTH domain|nr:helix-turn-helix transcriptional regulator [Actinospica sp.]
MRGRREEFARRRRAIGLSQEELADRLKVTARTVARWETGESEPVPWFRPRIASCLRVSLEELDALLIAPGRGPGTAISPLSGTITTKSEFYDQSAGEALAFADSLTLEAPAGDVLQLQERVVALASSYMTQSVDVVAPEAYSISRDAQALIPGQRSAGAKADLLVVVSRSLALLANAAMDTGNHSAAAHHAEAAARIASRVGHGGIEAWSRGLQASNAFWAGDFSDSLRIAATALPSASHGTTGVFLASLLARAAGRAGDRSALDFALAAAARARETARADEVEGVFGFSEAKQYLYAASGYLGLREDPRRALAYAQDALALYSTADTRSVGDEAGARIDVATAHLRLGEFDGAIEALSLVLELPAEMRVASIVTRLGRIRQEFRAAGSNTADVTAAVERIDAFRRAADRAAAAGQ